MAGIVGYKCKKCNFETKKVGVFMGGLEIEDHFEEVHKRINEAIKNHKKKRDIEIGEATEKAFKKYPLMLGKFIESIAAKPKKLWKCPDCKKEFSYNNKYYHVSNFHKYPAVNK